MGFIDAYKDHCQSRAISIDDQAFLAELNNTRGFADSVLQRIRKFTRQQAIESLDMKNLRDMTRDESSYKSVDFSNMFVGTSDKDIESLRAVGNPLPGYSDLFAALSAEECKSISRRAMEAQSLFSGSASDTECETDGLCKF